MNWLSSAAREKFPQETPRIISDNGAQFLAKDFKEFIRICGMTHVRTSPYYPQSNGKLERFTAASRRVHSAWHPDLAGRRGEDRGPLRRALQSRAIAQRNWLYRTGDKLAGREWRSSPPVIVS